MVAERIWLSLSDPVSLRFVIKQPLGLTQYEAKIAEDSASVGCAMAELFLHDVGPPEFPGGLLWIARTPSNDDGKFIIVEQLLRAGGISDYDWRCRFLELGRDEYNLCLSLVAACLMFGWDANFVLSDRRFLLTIDDEPFPSLITDKASPWFLSAAKNLEFKVVSLDGN